MTANDEAFGASLRFGLFAIALIALTACEFPITNYQTEARYKNEYVEFFSDGAYFNQDHISGYIKNVYNETLYITALWNFHGSSPMWIKKIEPNQSIDVYYWNGQVTYVVKVGAMEVDLIRPEYKEKEQ